MYKNQTGIGKAINAFVPFCNGVPMLPGWEVMVYSEWLIQRCEKEWTTFGGVNYQAPA